VKKKILLHRPSLRRKDFHFLLEQLLEENIAPGMRNKQLVKLLQVTHGMKSGVALRSYRLAIAYALRSLADSVHRVGMSALANEICYDEVQKAGYEPILFDTKENEVILSYEQNRCDALIVAPLCRSTNFFNNITIPIIYDVSAWLATRQEKIIFNSAHAVIISLEEEETLSVGGGGIFLRHKSNSQDYDPQEMLPDILSSLAITQYLQLHRFDAECEETAKTWNEYICEEQGMFICKDTPLRHFIIKYEKSWEILRTYAKQMNITIRPLFREYAAQKLCASRQELRKKFPHAYKHSTTLLQVPLYPHLRMEEKKRIASFFRSLP